MEKENNFKKEDKDNVKNLIYFFFNFLKLIMIPYIGVLIISSFEKKSIRDWDMFSCFCFFAFILLSIFLKVYDDEKKSKIK